jgi:transmembrane sensor
VIRRLPDGTRVSLQKSSSIRLSAAFSRSDRKLVLNGTAGFVTAPSNINPFLIHTGALIITVTGSAGASFTVDADTAADNTGEEVDVLTGTLKVRKSYHSSTDTDEWLLGPGEMIMINKSIDLIEKEKFDTSDWKNRHAND